MKKWSKSDLDKIRASREPDRDWIKVGMSTCGIAAGAEAVFEYLREEVARRGLPIEVKKCGCLGMCYAEPLVEVRAAGLPQVIYGQVNRELARLIVENHLVEKKLVSDHIYSFNREE